MLSCLLILHALVKSLTMAAFCFPSPHSSAHRIVHFEFGQNQLAQPQSTFEVCSGCGQSCIRPLFFAARARTAIQTSRADLMGEMNARIQDLAQLRVRLRQCEEAFARELDDFARLLYFWPRAQARVHARQRFWPH